jgi:hypothetical protein
VTSRLGMGNLRTFFLRCMLDRRHTRKLRKRDNLLTGDVGEGWGVRNQIIRQRESLVLHKSFNTLCPPPPARHTHTKRQTKTNKPLPLLSTFIHIFSYICTYVYILYIHTYMQGPVAKFIVLAWGDKVDSAIELSYRPANLNVA